MNEKKEYTGKIRSSQSARYERRSSTNPYRSPSQIVGRNNSCMVQTDILATAEYIEGLNELSEDQVVELYFTKSRVQELNSQRVVTRGSELEEKIRWYTTTCYLSSKMIIILFSMLSAFSLYPNTTICKYKTEATLLWLKLEKMLWDTLTTNSINYRSDPATYGLLGQHKHESLRDFLNEGSLGDIRDIIIGNTSPVSRGSILNSEPITSISELQSLFRTKRGEFNTLPCKNITKNFPMLGAISVKKDINEHDITEGIIHWFVFVQSSVDGHIYLYTSWADNTIESVMDKVDIDADEFDNMLTLFHLGTNQTTQVIDLIRKYFFTRPLGSQRRQLSDTDVNNYLNNTFVGDGRESIIGDRFSIIVYPDYYKSCYDILRSTIEYINSNDEIREGIMAPIETSIDVYRELSIPTNIQQFKLQLTYLYTTLGCSESIFFDESIFTRTPRSRKGGSRKSRKTRKTKRRTRKNKRTRRIFIK